MKIHLARLRAAIPQTLGRVFVALIGVALVVSCANSGPARFLPRHPLHGRRSPALSLPLRWQRSRALCLLPLQHL
jgi:hypothetical protein